MTDILIIRHGETPWNVERRVQGWHDVALNDNGQRQAQTLATFLAQRHQDGTEPLHALYSSDLTRAQETASIVDQALKLGLQTVAGVRERRYGVLEGLLFTKLHEQNPAAAKVWAAREPDGIIEGAETLNQFRTRVVQALNELAAKHPNQRIAVVTHGGAMDIIWRQAASVALQDPQRAKLLNASINRIAINDGQWSLIDWGNTEHLSGLSEHDVTV